MPGAARTFGFPWGTSATRSDVGLPLETLVAGGPEWDSMLKSLFRAAEAKWFDRSSRLTGSEKQHSRPELPLDRHRLGTLLGLLDAHLVAVADKGISGDVQEAAACLDPIDPDGDRSRYGHLQGWRCRMSCHRLTLC